MEYKAIITDIDKTLLRDDKTISEYTAGVLRNVRKMGIKIFLNTVRIFPTAKKYFNEFYCDAIAFSNGAGIIYNTGEKKNFLMEYQLAHELLSEILKWFPEIDISVMTPEGMYTNYDSSFVKKLARITRFPASPVERIMIKNGGAAVYDFLLMNVKNISEYEIQLVENKDIAITDKKASKLLAMKHILKYYHLQPEQVVGFGDDKCDINFLKYCGTSVAVANAKHEVKKICTDITLENESDGVGKWLEKNLL